MFQNLIIVWRIYICLLGVNFKFFHVLNFNKAGLNLSWRRLLSYRNQSIDLPSKSMDWFLYDNELRHENVNVIKYYCTFYSFINLTFLFLEEFLKKCWKNLRDNFSKCLKSRERKTRSVVETSTLPKCKLSTQMLFLKDSILNQSMYLRFHFSFFLINWNAKLEIIHVWKV